jgi:hypothetical protein
MIPNDHPTHSTLGAHTFRCRAIRTRKVIPRPGAQLELPKASRLSTYPQFRSDDILQQGAGVANIPGCLVSPPSIAARISASSARGSLREPISRQSLARSVAARSSSSRASWLRAISIALMVPLSRTWPDRRCRSASQKRSPVSSTRAKASRSAAGCCLLVANEARRMPNLAFVDGVDVTALPAHKRTVAGLARTFQNIRLFRARARFPSGPAPNARSTPRAVEPVDDRARKCRRRRRARWQCTHRERARRALATCPCPARFCRDTAPTRPPDRDCSRVGRQSHGFVARRTSSRSPVELKLFSANSELARASWSPSSRDWRVDPSARREIKVRPASAWRSACRQVDHASCDLRSCRAGCRVDPVRRQGDRGPKSSHDCQARRRACARGPPRLSWSHCAREHHARRFERERLERRDQTRGWGDV